MISCIFAAVDTVSTATSSGADPSFIGQLVLALGALSAAGLGGGYLLGRKHNVNISPHPLTVKEADRYATKDDIKDIKDDIHKIERLMRESESTAHKRMDDIAADLNKIMGSITLRPVARK